MTPGELRALPYLDDGPFAGEWAVRASGGAIAASFAGIVIYSVL